MKIGSVAVDVGSKGLHVSRVSHASPAAAPPPAHGQQIDFTEHGTSGQPDMRLYGSAVLRDVPELRWPQNLYTYQKMRRDAQYRSSLLLVKSPLLSAHWYVEPFSQDPVDIEAADFLWWALNNMHRPFMAFLKEALFSLDYGHYAFEKVFERGVWRPSRPGSHARVVAKWKDFAPRHPLTLGEIDKDEHGRPVGWWHTRNNSLAQRRRLDWDKLLVFTWDEEADDPRGIALGESAYLHYYYKHHLYKIDGIQKERHAIGIPDIQLPPGFKASDKKRAQEMGRNLRTNESAFVTRPPGWVIGFIEQKSQLVDVLKSADHHNFEIAKNALMQFVAATGGSNAKDESHINLTERALRYLADWFRQEINHHAGPELLDYNFELKGYPQLRARRVTDNSEARALSVALRNLTEPGIFTPTSEVEEFVAEILEFPPPSAEAQRRTINDRITANGTRVKGGSTNPNRDDAGNKSTGKSPSGNPTE